MSSKIDLKQFKELKRNHWIFTKGYGVNGAGDYIGTLYDHPETKVFMSHRGITSISAPAIFKDQEDIWRMIPTDQVYKVVKLRGNAL